jgi:hypothetical protein
MAWPTNFQGWIARVKKWLDVPDLDDDVFGFCLDSANERLNRDLSSQWMEKTYELVVEDPSQYFSVPSEIRDYNRMRLVTVRGSEPLVVVAINEFKIEMLNNNDVTPRVYCISNMELMIWPRPTKDSIIDIDYYAKIPALSSDQDENVFSTKHPDALLYAALLEATPFLQEDERLETWAIFYTGIKDSINLSADRATKGSTPLKREFKVM